MEESHESNFSHIIQLLTGEVAKSNTFAGRTSIKFGAVLGRTCFGEGLEALGQPVQTPHFPAGPVLQIDQVFEFDTHGAYAGRVYLMAAKHIHADDWFFQAH